MQVSITDYETFIAFWIIFTRWVTIIFQLPVYDNASVPVNVKVLSSLVIAYCFFPITKIYALQDLQYVGMDNWMFLTIYYAVSGLIIGYIVKIIMSLFLAAGALVTQQIGFSAVNYFDPTAGQGIGPFEKIIQWCMIIIVINSGALFPMFKGTLISFDTLQFVDFNQITLKSSFFISFFKSIFSAAFILATPVIFANLLLMMVMGIIARAIPQMNILMVSFVVNIGVGLFVFTVTSTEFFNSAFRFYTEKLGEWFNLIN